MAAVIAIHAFRQGYSSAPNNVVDGLFVFFYLTGRASPLLLSESHCVIDTLIQCHTGHRFAMHLHDVYLVEGTDNI